MTVSAPGKKLPTHGKKGNAGTSSSGRTPACGHQGKEEPKPPTATETPNHYAVMDIADFSSSSDAKKAYHRLALLWHPDRQMHLPEDRRKSAEDAFKVSAGVDSSRVGVREGSRCAVLYP